MDVHDTEHVVALCGSRGDGSHTRAAPEAALAAAEAAGATTDLVDYAGVESSPENNTTPTEPTAD